MKMNGNDNAEIDDKLDDIVEFIQDGVPGPGYYQVQREFDNREKHKKGISMKHNYRDYHQYIL